MICAKCTVSAFIDIHTKLNIGLTTVTTAQGRVIYHTDMTALDLVV